MVVLEELQVRQFGTPQNIPNKTTVDKFYGLTAWFATNKEADGTAERIYGLGQHKTGQLDNVGEMFHLQPQNTEILIPVYHSTIGYSFLMNLPSFGTVEIGKPAAAAPPPCPTAPQRCPEHDESP